MNVGIATDFYYPWIGGPAAAIRSLATGLTSRGHAVHVLAPSATGKTSVENESGFRVTRVRTVRAPVGYDLRLALPQRAIGRWLDAANLDVLQYHHPFPLSATAMFAARRRGIPLVATNHTIPDCSLWGLQGMPALHSIASWGFGQWLGFVLRQADVVTTPTATAARMLRQAGFNPPVRTVSNGIDTERFSPGAPDRDLRSRLGLDERPIVLYTGRLDPEKAMGVWLQAAAKAAECTDAQFVIGGNGTDRPRLEQMVSGLGLATRTTFIGYVDDRDLPALYRLASVYMMLAPVELQSISTLEAAATGLPVVASRAGALPELVHDGKNGFLTEPGDWQAAAGALVDLLRDKGKREIMGRESRSIALSHDLSVTISAYERVFEEAREIRRGGKRSGRAYATRRGAPGWPA